MIRKAIKRVYLSQINSETTTKSKKGQKEVHYPEMVNDKARYSSRVLRYDVVFEEQEVGGYTVTVPALPGCISEGDTFEEAKENITEAALSRKSYHGWRSYT